MTSSNGIAFGGKGHPRWIAVTRTHGVAASQRRRPGSYCKCDVQNCHIESDGSLPDLLGPTMWTIDEANEERNGQAGMR